MKNKHVEYPKTAQKTFHVLVSVPFEGIFDYF